MNIPRSTEGNLQLQHNHDFSFHGVIYLVEEDTVWDLVGQKGLVNWGGETGSYWLGSLCPSWPKTQNNNF